MGSPTVPWFGRIAATCFFGLMADVNTRLLSAEQSLNVDGGVGSELHVGDQNSKADVCSPWTLLNVM